MNSDTLFQLLLTAAAVALIIVAIEYIVPKIHRAIRRWWISGQWTCPEQIEFSVVTFTNGCRNVELRRGRPGGVRGLHLLVVTDRGQEMVSAGAALDQEQFWKTWKHLGGQVDGWMDEDTGEKINLTDL